MKKYLRKTMAFALAVVVGASGIAPVSLAAPDNKKTKSAVSEEVVFDDYTKSILEAAKVMASYSDLTEDGFKVESEEKEAIKEAIFHHHEEETDLSEYDMSSVKMDKLVEEVLEENHMEDTVEVTYETNDENVVTTMTVEMDSLVVMAGEEAAGLTSEQKEELMAKYSQYMSFVQENAELFGVQTPYFTNKDKVCPIGSLLAIAGIPNEYLGYGIDVVIPNIMSFEEVKGVIDLFHYANVFAAQLKGSQIAAAREEALKAVEGAKTDVQKHLQLTDWLAQWCTFDMPYIMEMEAPIEDTDSPMYTDMMTIYQVMYEQIKKECYDGYYQYLTYVEGYPAEMADQIAQMMAKSFMDDPTQDGSDNGSASAMTLASSIINLWEGSHVGALTYKTAVCLGYSNAYVYLVQYLYDDIYRNADGTWKTYEELNSGSNGNWDAIVDYVRITFDAEVTMFGVTEDNFQSDHYWNAVKLDGKWYYVDPCYVDVYVEVMARDRVETNGNINHLYFMFSHDTAAELYDGYYKELDTLYAGIATDKQYEDAWFAFAKSPVAKYNDKYYYVYDSTDLIEMQNNYEMTEEDIVYKLVEKNIGRNNSEDAKADYDRELIDFTNGQVYNPRTRRMENNSMIQKFYAEFESYKEDYPSLVITSAMYDGKIYFNLSNCILSYDFATGTVTRLIEYNTVTAERDLTVAFGGMSFTEAENEGEYGVTVKNPPIAGFAIRNGEMTVDIATTLGYISGKKSHTEAENEPEDTSSYGYMFEETNFNEEYLYASYSGMGDMMDDVDTDNDNDEFMWSANIYETIDMAHLTGNHGAYVTESVEDSCTEQGYEEQKCATCGLIQNGNNIPRAVSKNPTHEYVRFKEKYYTKDDSGKWNEAVNYVCIHCKDVVESKPAKTVSVNMDEMSFVWTWARDYSAATCYRIPTELSHVKLDCVWENSSVGSMRRQADEIVKSMEGTCDEGVVDVYTAIAGAVSEAKKQKQAPAPHQYVADEISFDWAEDNSKCDIDYKCSFCGKEESFQCAGEDMLIEHIEPTCLEKGRYIYTASVTLEGNVYADTTEAEGEDPLGHEYAFDEEANDETCIRCKAVKPDSSITIPETQQKVYTDTPVDELADKCVVEGTQAEPVITYYKDEACTVLTTQDDGAEVEGAVPSNVGIYYAKAAVDADAQYKAAESGICKITIVPNYVGTIKKSNVINGVKLTWTEVPEASVYEVYRKDPNEIYEKIATVKQGDKLELIDEDVVAGSTYVYDIRTYTETEDGKIYSEVNAKGTSIVHTNITLSNTQTGVSVKWTKVEKASTYKVYRKAIDSESEYKLIATLDADKTSYKDKTAKNGVKYYYYVKPNVSGTTNVGIKVYLTNPDIESISATSKTKLKVSWNKNTKAAGYRVRYSTSKSFSSYKTTTVSSYKTLTKTLSSLKSNKTYYVKVQSYKKSGGVTYYSAWSDVKSKKTKK